jgi:hypothetical protein
MSDSAIIIAELTTSTRDAPARAAATAAWLLGQEVIQPNDQRDRIRQPSQYLPGPAATTAAPAFHQYPELANSGIDIIDQRQVHDPGGNYTPPTCPSCSVALAEDTHIALIEPWLEDAEPSVTCPACSATALLGDWNGQWAIHVANLAVRFNNWPALSDQFVSQLCDQLGSRCRTIYQRI